MSTVGIGIGVQGSGIIAQNSALIDNLSYFSDKIQEGFSIVDKTLREVQALRETQTLLKRIARIDEEDEQQVLLGLLCVLQEKNNAMLERMAETDEQDEQQVLLGQIRDLQEKNNDMVEQLRQKVLNVHGLGVVLDIPNGTNLGGVSEGKEEMSIADKLGVVTNLYSLTKNRELTLILSMLLIPPPDPPLEYQGLAYQDMMEQIVEPQKKNEKLNAQNIDIAGKGFTFAESNKISHEKSPDLCTYDLKVKHSQFLSELYSDSVLLLNSDKNVRNSLLSALEIPPSSEENQPTRIYISNGSAETEPDSNMIRAWQENSLLPKITTPNQIMMSQFSPKLINPQTGADEGALDTLPAGNASPYQMDGVGADSNGTLNAQDGFSERLAAALEKLAEVCALPRVSVGTLAETAVVREEADLDTLARRLADELLHAQMVS